MKVNQFSWGLWVQNLALLIAVFIFGSCSDSPLKKELKLLNTGEHTPVGIEMIYPQNGTIFPPEFPAPDFEWEDSTGNPSEWHVFVSDIRGNVLISSKSDINIWKPTPAEWENIKELPASDNYSFTAISAKEGENSFPSCRMQFSFSRDSVGDDIFYRAVPLPFSYAVKNVHTIEWYMGSVKGSKPHRMLDNLPVCWNCHSFSKDQPLLAMDDLNKAIETDSNQIESYFNRIILNNVLRQSNSKEDRADKEKAIQLVLGSLA